MAARSFVEGLACGECGERYPIQAAHVCEMCFGPLEVRYDMGGIAAALTREVIARRPETIWRYAELLPLAGAPTVALDTRMTPLVRADRLAARLGVRELWVKNDGVSHPTLSFKDRVVGVALSKAREFGIATVACASTGNLANATAAHAAAAGLKCVVLVPHDVEPTKILATTIYGAEVVAVEGTYDDVNRLSSEIAARHGWGFVNINLKPFYAEGSKTYGYEIAEQLGWRLPAHVVVPMAGGSLLAKIGQAFSELTELGLVDRHAVPPKMHGAQAAGCAPIASMIIEGREEVIPVKTPKTLAKSLAIGDPGDAYVARRAILGSGGFAAAPDDEESLEGVRLLAETEGIFVEIGSGVAVAAVKRLVAEGKIGPQEGPVVICVTGQGMKTQDALAGRVRPPTPCAPRLASFESLLAGPLRGLI